MKKLLVANFKHLYQWRVLFGIEMLFLLLFCAISFLKVGHVRSVHEYPRFMEHLEATHHESRSIVVPEIPNTLGVGFALSFAGVFIVASMQRSVFSKPFSFCLPMQRQILWRMLLISSCLCNIPGAVFLFIAHYGYTPLLPLLCQSIAVFFVGMCVSAFATYFAFVSNLGFMAVGFIQSAGYLLEWTGVMYVLNTAITFFPLATILGCGVILLLFRKWVDAPRFFRENCAEFSHTILFYAWIRKRPVVRDDWFRRRWEKYKLVRLEKSAAICMEGTTWWALWKGYPASLLKNLFTGLLPVYFVVVLLGYVGISLANTPVIFRLQDGILLVLPCLLLVHIQNLYSPFLFPAGRKERFRHAATSGMQIFISIMVMAVTVGFISHTIAPILPTLYTNNKVMLSYLPAHYSIVVFLLAYCPFVLLITALCPKNTARFFAVGLLFFALFISFGVVSAIIDKMTNPVGMLTCLMIACALGACWLVTLRRRAYGWDL